MRRTAAWLAVAVAVVLTVAGCSGVPGSSEPQVVRTIGLGEAPPASAPAPPLDANPRSIVEGFLDAMRTSPDQLDVARAYLDDEAAQTWSGSTVTVTRGLPPVGVANPADNSVVVTYQQIGSLDDSGIYSPVLAGDGANPDANATFFLTQNKAGQWRIGTPVPAGLFIPETDFARLFPSRPLYFLDSTGTRLVPDLRYSALAEPSLESFLLAQLVAGPRPELKNAVASFVPAPTGSQRVTVTPGSPTVVQVPGAAALDARTRTRLAAQLSYTLRSNSFLSELQLRDGNQPVDIPGTDNTFDPGDFAQFATVSDTAVVTPTYLHAGAVVDATGKPLSGPLGSGQFDSAVFDGVGSRTMVAATSGPPGPTGVRQLLVGTSAGVQPVAGVPAGPLSQPAWAPIGTTTDADEVWVATGGQLWRVEPGKTPTQVAAAGRNGPLTGTITGLSFSPEGTRLALVISSLDGTSSQVWLGSVVRSGPDVRLDQVEPVTPAGVVVDDVGWRTETALVAVGTAPGFAAGVLVDLAVDGSRLGLTAPDGLPDRPRSIAVSPRGAEQWVAVGVGGAATVWTRPASGGSWGAPGGGATQAGYGPSYSS